ncbi:hypothetical protein EXVG_00090 [Emiliania huxleyi virus 202]|nr:hypothetical protein EXVG_00090 [Emiliania huxleyi virus 202]AHA54456.1 hypothetical protein EhV18_00410 [Emiliania huxleyi virus 18]AHA55498.1 hypothetical protein EhV156_00403 [Emiliania huxleyi virus 156]
MGGPGSTFSDTDVRHFMAIGNPEQIDMHARVEPTLSSTAPRMPPPRPQDGTEPFTLAAQRQRGAGALPIIAEGGSTQYDSSSSDGEVISSRIIGGKKSDAKKPSKPDRPSRPARSNVSAPVVTKKKSFSNSGSDSDSYSDYSNSSDGSTSRKARTMAASKVSSAPPETTVSSSVKDSMPQYDRQSKQDMLYELDKFVETHNVKLSRHFTMNDNIGDIERELNMHRQQVSDASMIVIMREGLLALTAGVEMANSRLGLLSLDGWSTEVAADSRRYDPTLVRLKQKYMRTSVLQPEAELAFLLGSSAISFHIKSRNKKIASTERRENRRKSSKNVEETDDEEDEALPTTFTEPSATPE